MADTSRASATKEQTPIVSPPKELERTRSGNTHVPMTIMSTTNMRHLMILRADSDEEIK